jgi:hypothetical protein
MRSRSGLVALLVAVGAAQAHADVTVFLERHGHITHEGVRVPAFGGGDQTWHAIVACVREQYAPFAVDIVDTMPEQGPFITAVIGGRASLLGLDDDKTNGVGPYSGDVIDDAVVHVFSQVGTGERDVENLCATTVHEVGHALGLEHEYYCGDVMSYFLARCGPRRFIDVDAACGEEKPEACATGEDSQNSYRRLGQLVGFRGAPPPEQDDQQDDDDTVSVTICDGYHCQSRNFSRSSVFLNFPADVRGIASTNTNASGNQNFAKRGAKKPRSSSGVHSQPARKTTTARGRSLQRG